MHLLGLLPRRAPILVLVVFTAEDHRLEDQRRPVAEVVVDSEPHGGHLPGAAVDRQQQGVTPVQRVAGGLALGLYADRNDLWVFGAKGGKLALARKNWGRIGQNDATSPQQRWRFRTAKGWSSEVADLAALPGDIPTSGPVSVAQFRDRFYLTVPAHANGQWTAQTYTSRSVDTSWTKHTFTAALGNDASYLGGTAA